MNAKTKLMLVCVIAVLATACEKKEILAGKRESISGITVESTAYEITEHTKQVAVTPTSPESISSYVDAGGNKQHSSVNYQFGKSQQKRLWKTSIGFGPINAGIIAVNNNIYAVNSAGNLVCVSQKDGKKLWEKQIAKQPKDGEFSGGLTANGSVIFISTNVGTVVAIDSVTQKELWSTNIKYPLKGSPIYVSGKIVVNSVENQTFAIDASDGKIIWTKTVSGEKTMMAISGAPAVFGNEVICAYSSGDIVSLDLEDGSDNWSDVLFSANSSESGSVISHIAASPVVVGDNILVATSESKLALIDATSGIRIWEKDIGTIYTPVVNNNFAFILSSEKTIVCISIKDGSVVWVKNVEDIASDKSKSLNWCGPLLINGDIVIFSENGDLLRIDISSGNIKSQETIKGTNIANTPIIVNGKMFITTSRAEIHALG